MANIFDKNGREIMVGDVLKVYHFTAALRRKKHYMYKQVMIADKFRDGTDILRVGHLDLTDDFYTLICDGKHLPDHEVIQSIDCKHEQRPRTPTPQPTAPLTKEAGVGVEMDLIERIENCVLFSTPAEYAGLADHAAFEAGQDNAIANVVKMLRAALKEATHD